MTNNPKCININKHLRTKNGLVSLLTPKGIAARETMPQMFRVASVSDLPDFDKLPKRSRAFSSKGIDKYILFSIKRSYLEIEEEVDSEYLKETDERLVDLKLNHPHAVGNNINKFKEMIGNVSFTATNGVLYDLQNISGDKKSTLRVLVKPELFPQDERMENVVILYKQEIGMPLLIPKDAVRTYHKRYDLVELMEQYKV